ncbi:MAG: 2-C-methyl-D-erythritol 2,4-cyclodiphosphate synthase [Bacteroidetes bacterium]|nr:2-C-methyl-D-erythritol 2,4-cyclodiphosphate synthase [Bacteroidota bacterium]
MIKIGFGYDVHKFAPERKLVLGGVEIPFTQGLEGHSDADVLLHAICDALLGAAALGDIGTHFPNTDSQFKNIESTKLLANVLELIKKNNYKINNIDSTVCLEEPKLLPHIDSMREKISVILGIEKSCISIKATTNEKMGFVGRGEGIAAFAVALLEERKA